MASKRQRHGIFPIGSLGSGATSAEFDMGDFEDALLFLDVSGALDLTVQATSHPLAQARLVNAIAFGDPTAELGEGAQNFPTGGGQITIAGDLISYGSRADNVLSGLSGIQAQGHSAGRIVLLEPGSDDRVWFDYETISPTGAGAAVYALKGKVPRFLRFTNGGAGTINTAFIEGIRSIE